MPDNETIYKICSRRDWQAALDAGYYAGSADDERDGFIHFSTAGQLAGTAEKHFRGQGDLVLVAVKASALGGDLKWEASRGGALFPHLYGRLNVTAARLVGAMPLDARGVPLVPQDLE